MQPDRYGGNVAFIFLKSRACARIALRYLQMTAFLVGASGEVVDEGFRCGGGGGGFRGGGRFFLVVVEMGLAEVSLVVALSFVQV